MRTMLLEMSDVIIGAALLAVLFLAVGALWPVAIARWF